MSSRISIGYEPKPATGKDHGAMLRKIPDTRPQIKSKLDWDPANRREFLREGGATIKAIGPTCLIYNECQSDTKPASSSCPGFVVAGEPASDQFATPRWAQLIVDRSATPDPRSRPPPRPVREYKGGQAP
jgi:hypothetical protein